MVFMKKVKGGKPNQKVQGKKPFQKEADIDMSDDDFDDDMDSDDSDDVIVSKTPKGKQTPNDKRVSFQVPGKNTPAKTPVGKKQATPAKENSVSKKQATPGKGSLQKFKGIEQKNQKAKKGSQPEEDDDEEEDDEDDSDFGGDLDLNMGSDDDEEDDDDNDDEDDDDDDDDDDEEEDEEDSEDEEDEENNQKNLKKGKTQKQNVVQAKQTPLKGKEKQNAQSPKNAQTPKGAQTPKSNKDGQTPKSIKKENNAVSPKKANAVAALEEERRKDRDSKQLYAGNLPKEVTIEELKALSSDIVSVNLIKRPKLNNTFAFLQFASEAKAEENLKKIKAKPFKGSTLNIDYVGFKSSHQSKDAQQLQYNLKRLFVSSLPLDVTVHQVAKFFPKCHTVTLNQSPAYRTATVNFFSEEDGTAAFQETKDIELNGVKLSVLHSRVTRKPNSKRKRAAQKKNKDKKNNGPGAKKMKFMQKDQGSSDEE